MGFFWMNFFFEWFLIHACIMYLIIIFFRIGFSYIYPDPYENYFESSEGDLHWRCSLPPSLLIKSKLWLQIRKLVNNLPHAITNNEHFLPYAAYGTMLQRGDVPVTFRGLFFSSIL